MFNVDEKFLYNSDKGTFPAEKPRYTISENVEYAVREMKATIDRMLKFENRVKKDIADLSSQVSSDNVIFKDTLYNAWQIFQQELKNEVNLFESNVDATVSLFQTDVESNYSNLSEELNGQVTTLESKYLELYNTFSDNISKRIDTNNATVTQAFNDYKGSLTTEVNAFELSVNEIVDTFTQSINNTINTFKQTWEQIITDRLRVQDDRISDNEMYMKTNLANSIQALLSDLHQSGEFSEIIQGEIFNDLTDKINKTATYVTPQMYGAKGDGVTDDTLAIQKCVIHAYKNNEVAHIPNGIYKISKPIIVYGSSNELAGGVRIIGETIESTIFKASEDFTPYNTTNGYIDVSAMFILLNEKYLDGENLINSSESDMKHDVLFQDFKILGNNIIDYGIWTNNCAFSTFKRLRIRNCNIAGLTSSGYELKSNFYLNIIEKVRIDGCPTSFLLAKGINTSVKIDSCYSVGATECGYKIGGIYMTMINNCIDGCTGVCYDLKGYNGVVIGSGSESKNASVTFKGGQYTNVLISGGYCWGNYEDENATHILCDVGANMTFDNVNLAFDNTETNRELIGYLYKQSFSSTLNIKDCNHPVHYKKDDSEKDYTQRLVNSDRFGYINSRHKNDLKYIGYDTKENGSNQHLSNAQAIYFGMGEQLGWLSDGTDIRWHRPANVGDLCLTKSPNLTYCAGYVNVISGNGFTAEGSKWLPIAINSSLTTDEINQLNSSYIANGTCIFNSTLGMPVWKKGNGVWVKADGTQM
jgi:hypothetical protein